MLTMIPPRVFAAETIKAEINFSKDSNKFTLSVNNKDANADGPVNYAIVYRTDKDKNEAITGKTDKNLTDNFQKDFYAGTCSANGACIPDVVIRGILKVEVESQNWITAQKFAIDDGKLKLVEEYMPADSDPANLTDAENYWLEHGSEPTPTPTATPTATLTSTVTVVPSITPIPTVVENGQILDGVTTQKLASLKTDGHVDTTIVQSFSCRADSLNGCLTTNKSDYSPTDVAVISGYGFAANTQYTLKITSSDPPAVNFETTITTDANGSFTASYQLDGNYRPNYSVELKDLNGNVVATTTFTDAPPAGVTLTAATGGSTIGSATNITDGTVTWTTLTGPTISEGSKGDINTGTIILNVATGFVFDIGGTAPNVLVTGDSNANKNINDITDGGTITLTTITSSALTLTITSKSSGTPNVLTWQNVRVRPTAATPLASGNITKSGTSSYTVVGGATNYGTLTEVDTTVPTVTINQADGQSDPTSTSPINFTVIFSETVSDFATGDVTLNGTAGATTAIVTGSGTTYNVAVSGMTSNGTVIASLAAGVAHDAAGNASAVSTSSDNTVTYVTTGTLKIVKKTTGGNDTFNFTVTGSSGSTPSITTSDGNGSSGPTTVNTGTYSVKETVPNGWNLTSASCDDGSSAFSVDTVSGINITAGKNVICTFNDSKLPTLTLTKTVNNTHGGTKVVSDFVLKIDDSTVVTSGVTNTVSIGPHTASEVNLAGYSASAWGTDCATDGTITLAAGDNKTCTITNSDIAPTLKLVKQVTNDNGGAAVPHDWTLTATGTGGFSDAGDSTTFHEVTASVSYSLSESAVSGYAASNWSCDGGNLSGSSLTLGLNQNVTCTITNNDQQGTLIVKKVIVNDNGGTKSVSDFSFQVNDGDATTFNSNGENDITVDAGTYNVTEPAVSGYATAYDNCSGVVIPNGGSATCTITNNDIQPKLTITKIVQNNYGGTAVSSDFPLYANSTQVTSGVQTGFNTGTYTVSEAGGPSGYTGVISGDCNPSTGNITLNVGDVKSCTITNNDQPGEIHGMKFEDHNGNGVKDEGDNGLQNWTIFLDTNGNGVKDEGEPSTTTDANGNYAFTNLSIGTYKVREVLQNGWTHTTPNPADITLTNGQVVNNVNFGNFKNITISGQKYNDSNGNGVKNEGELGLSGWTINLTHNESTSSATTDVNGNYSFSDLGPGTYRIREVLQALWAQTSNNPDDITASSGTNVPGIDFGNKEVPPQISSETSSSVNSSSVIITWTTDHPATSRVVYDTVSHAGLGEAPNYGYANSTVETDTSPKVTSHSVGLTGLSSGTTYYYRTVSHGSPEAVSSEKTFATSSTAGGGGGGVVLAAASTNTTSAPVCSDTKPGSAPTLTSAVAGVNSVTLFWTQANNPVSYYLATYGTSPGSQTYGNPNIGGSGTTSYTISGLSGGTTYYFKVRAGNGCMPGDFSNELASTPTGGFLAGPAQGFAPGVLGVSTPEAKITGGQGPSEVLGASASPTLTPALTGAFFGSKAGIAFIIILITLILFFLYKRRKASK